LYFYIYKKKVNFVFYFGPSVNVRKNLAKKKPLHKKYIICVARFLTTLVLSVLLCCWRTKIETISNYSGKINIFILQELFTNFMYITRVIWTVNPSK